MEEEIETREENIKNRVKEKFYLWLKDPYNKLFLAIFIFAIIIRIYFLSISIHQPVWWDAADYLTEAKILAGRLSIDYSFTPRRTFLMPLFWTGLIKLGFGEISFRILEFLFSIAAIPITYLIGKSLFDKKIGLVFSFFFSIFWMHLFYSNRLMTEIPSLTLLLFSIYFFWDAYHNRRERSYIWFGIFLGLSFLARAGTLVMFAVFPLFLIIKERLKFLKNRYLWISTLCVFLLTASFFIFTSIKQKLNAVVYFLALTPETAQGGIGRFQNIMGLSGIKEYASAMPHYFGLILLFIFLFGLVLFVFELFIGFDLILKNEDNKQTKYLFIFLLGIIPFIFQAIFYNHFEDRYLMNAFPSFFLILSIGLTKIEEKLKKYHKYLGIFIIFLLLGIGAYQQIIHANLIIESKKTSYLEVKQAGEWLKENSKASDIIFSASVPQHTYYAEREVYNFVHPGVNESEFEEKINELKPNFLVLSIFEPHAQWTYEYPQKHPDLLIPVKVYEKNQQPVLIVYRFNYNENTPILRRTD